MAGGAIRRITCRLCGSGDLAEVFSLGATPLANAFVPRQALGLAQAEYPLDVVFCNRCTHVQLRHVVDPVELYAHYVYVSGTSPVFVRHFGDYAAYVLERFAPPANGLVVDIGANDGTMLKFFRQAGRRVLGIEPAKEISDQTRAAGIPVINDFFAPPLAERIRTEHGVASIVTANNVLAHIDDIASVMDGVRQLLAPDGVLVFEVSYLADVIEKTLFDTIYHEHLDYHAVRPLVGFLERCGLQLIEALRVDSHGGSVRCVAQLMGGARPIGASVASAIALEQRMGLERPETYRAFATHVAALKSQFVELLRHIGDRGERIAGFGAPAKATTLLYHFGIAHGVLDFIVDDSPLKQGLYSPGSHIPVVSAKELYERRPGHLVVLAWNFADAIIAKHKSYAEAGGRFIVPLPRLRVI